MIYFYGSGGSIDDTEELRQAINDSAGGDLHISGKVLIRELVADSIILLDQPRNIYFERDAVLIVASDTPANVDVIRVCPAISADPFMWKIDGLAISPQAGHPARHGVNIELGEGNFLAKFIMNSARISGIGGNAFRQSKTNGVDGFFTSSVSDSILIGESGSVHLENCGDSLQFHRCTLTGPGLGVYVEPVGGAMQILFSDCNITNRGGAFHVKNGYQVKITRNQMEQNQDYTGSLDAQVYFDNCIGCDLDSNNINSWGRVVNVILEGASEANIIRRNLINVVGDAGKPHVRFGANVGARNILSGDNIYQVNNACVSSPWLEGALTKPQFGMYAGVPLQNSWLPHTDSTRYQGLLCALSGEREVSLRGAIYHGINAVGTLIAVLPIGARPVARAVRISVLCLISGAWEVGILNIDTLGQVKIGSVLLPTNTLVVFDSVRFSTY